MFMSYFPKSNPLPTLSPLLGKEIEVEVEHKVKIQFPATLVTYAPNISKPKFLKYKGQKRQKHQKRQKRQTVDQIFSSASIREGYYF
jgi:hypothetical protein